MSFFGFDPSVPPHLREQARNSELYDFQETYDGLGEQLDEEDDAFNQETFGTANEIGKDFDFGQATEPVTKNPISQPSGQTMSYAAVALNPSNDDEFMKELWGSSNAPSQQVAHEQAGGSEPEKKILSLEEIEAQLTSIDQSQRFVPQQQPYGVPGMLPSQYGGYMMPHGGMMPPPVSYGQYPGMLPQQLPPQVQQMGAPGQLGQQPPQVNQQPPQAPAAQQPMQQVVPPQQQVARQPADQLQQSQVPHQKQATQEHRAHAKADLSQFPVLGSKSPVSYQPHQQQHHQHQPHQPHQQHHHQNHQQYGHSSQGQFGQNSRKSPNPNSQSSLAELDPEQQEKLARRQEKVHRIMRYSGIMNPKDKDFVTRFQLSQIVTEDPYNEDFYAQVFKVIHPKANSNPIQQQSQQNNSIAQAYLEQSGHRLGGRYKRADVALQRMQQQVQKAVTVAKERPKLTQYAREGALGKISFGSGKKPRQQLEIFSKAAQSAIEKQEGDESSQEQLSENVKTGENQANVKKNRAPSIAAVQKPFKRYTKKDIMSVLENIITNLMNVESKSRLSNDVNTAELWESLHVLDQPDELEINIFIQCLNYKKALKILQRLFKFLSREQILTIVTLIMSNLENLSVIRNGSYTTYEDKKVPESVLKLVEAYSLSFSKVLMNAVQDFKFNEIIGLLVILIEHNNVSFVSTTKIGLSILTTLLSRAELIRGEGSISATDLSSWSSCYDELFTSLESRIVAIFPPHPEDIDDGSSSENYVWQFLATLSLGGKLSHQRIIVDEVRDEIFGVMNRAKAIDNSDVANLYKKQNLLNNLNMYLVVMGLVADENEIKELQN